MIVHQAPLLTTNLQIHIEQEFFVAVNVCSTIGSVN